ncbi:hypothetical protein [Nitrosovibrio sp. Nv17]|uniref:hypothetical protein n=1 Tax=Nitrosovibrio sp. Nv17 TaxID=1855339 RepID=UPI001C48446B|nr:hypothetical protein [Nitrosovibrio sp. Nv17]
MGGAGGSCSRPPCRPGGGAEIQPRGRVVGGHALKYPLAALAAYRISYTLERREP